MKDFFLPSSRVTDTNERRKGLKVNLTPEAHAVVKAIKAKTGIQNQTAMERVLEWFAAQEDAVQVAILTGQSNAWEIMSQRKIAEAVAAGNDADKMTVEQAAEMARVGLSRLEQMGAAYRDQMLGRRMKNAKPQARG